MRLRGFGLSRGADLHSTEVTALETLGWTQKSWDGLESFEAGAKESANLQGSYLGKDWFDLDENQTIAAKALGFSSSTWTSSTPGNARLSPPPNRTLPP